MRPHRVEQVFVQTLVAEPAVGRLGQTVLHRPAGRGVMPLDLALLAMAFEVSSMRLSETAIQV